ncbi:MAG: TonB family protein [Pyrinomonadaceae bacterium]
MLDRHLPPTHTARALALSLSALLLIPFATSAAFAQDNAAVLRPTSSAPTGPAAPNSTAGPARTREQDGLFGPVRRIRTETAKLYFNAGKLIEGPRAVLAMATYDVGGTKIDSAFYPMAGASATGKEQYKYDGMGNITEMTLRDKDGYIVRKELYTYEFDSVGNWVKMTTSAAVVEDGKLALEPIETTYRSITYYLDEFLARIYLPPSTTKAAGPANPQPVKTGNTAEGAAANRAGAAKSNKPDSSTTKQPAETKQPIETKKTEEAKKTDVLPAATVPQNTPAPEGGKSLASGAGLSAVEEAGASTGDAAVASPAASTDTTASAGKPISGGVLNGKALSLPPPPYPDIAKRLRIEGAVAVEVVIDATGKVVSARATSGPGTLHQAAERAAMLARFSPTLLSGQPTQVSGIISYNFSLPQ